MRIAVVGSGIAGLTTAYLLDQDHQVTVLEAGEHVGGHTRTVEILDSIGTPRRVDTGFVVFNEATYPGLLALFRHLGVGWTDSDMSFSVSCARTGLEYCGTSPATLFAQPRNLLRPRFLGMLRDILRFNRRSLRLLERDAVETPTLGAYLEEGGYGRAFRDHYLVPMASSVWSTSPARMMEFPAGFLLRFFRNHRFLTADGHLTWKVVRGGSDRYVAALLERFRGTVRTGTRVLSVRREAGGGDGAAEGDGGRRRGAGGGVAVRTRGADSGTVAEERFDAVVVATHADQALALLGDPSPAEEEILSAVPFVENEVVVHTDPSLLPRAPRARASWNYHVLPEPPEKTVVTYDMTRLQGLGGPDRFLVTLNRTGAVDPARVHLRFRTGHPVFTVDGWEAQGRHGEISGRRGTHYAGAWWRNGFHEDGVWSAFRVARELGVDPAERLGAPELLETPEGGGDGARPRTRAPAGAAAGAAVPTSERTASPGRGPA
jgi:predicted NAD/FAD-binding protein